MKWFVQLALVSAVVALGSIGCNEAGVPPAFAAESPTAAAGTATGTGGGCSTTGIAAGSGSVGDIGAELAIAQHGFVEAMEANEEADHTRERHLSRVALALTAEQQRAFLVAYEGLEHVVKVRKEYAAKTLELAAKLDEIDRSDDLATFASQTESTLLFAAYDLLSQSACPARSIRFAGMALAQREGAPSRYPGLANTNAKKYAMKYILTATAGALVERALATGKEPAALLPELHAWIATVNGDASVALNVIKSQESVLEASRAGQKVVVLEQNVLPVLQSVGTVLSIWGAAEDVARGDIEALLLHSGADGIAAVLNGTNAVRRAMLMKELLWAGKAAAVIGKLSGGIGILTQTCELIDGIRTMKDRDDAIRTLGNALLLTGSVVALTGGSGAILIAAGTAAKILADILATPPEDEVRTLLTKLAADGVIPTESVEPLTKARNGSLRSLKEDLALPPEEVLWLVTRSSETASNDGGYRGLVQIGKTFEVTAEKMTAFLHGITDPADMVWQRWELYIFLGYVDLSQSFNGTDGAGMKDTLQHWVGDFSAGDSDAKEWGKPKSEMTAHGRGVFRKAIAALP
jgi:hypothetical protein